MKGVKDREQEVKDTDLVSYSNILILALALGNVIISFPQEM